jgi:hypothetical protein
VDGGVLREWRRSRGWDAPELARRLRKAADGGAVPEPGSLKRMIWRWEREGLRNERYELLYARALGVDPDDLAGGPPGTTVSVGRPGAGDGGQRIAVGGPGAAGERAGSARPAGADGTVPSDSVLQPTDDVLRALLRIALVGSARAGSLDVDDVERRELLKLIGSIGLAAPFAGGGHADRIRRELDSSLNAPTTEADVAEWERVAAQYSAESGVVPPAVLLPELLTDLDEAQARLKDSPDALRAPMARACGFLSALAAMNFFNAGDEGNARRYWRTALRIIGQADDRPTQAVLMAERASFILLEGSSSPSAALALADEAVSVAGGVACAGAASARGTRAMALALLGDHGASAHALDDLSDSYARLPGFTVSARSSWGFSEQQLRFIEGHVHAYAGRVSDAGRALDTGVSMVPDGQWIAVTSFEVNRAISLIRGGDPSEGARHVARAVQALPAGYRQSATTRRASRALDAVPVGAASLPAVAEARELLALPPGA